MKREGFLNQGCRSALKFYCRARSLHYAAQYWALNRASQLLGFKTPIRYQDRELLELIQKGLEELIDADLNRIEQGIYPVSVLAPHLNSKSLWVLPRVVIDGFSVGLRRTLGQPKEFSAAAREFLEGLPEYYKRNFHYQTDGYLSDASAEVYDYEVDLLFSGATDAMRRLLIEPLKKHFKDHPEGRGLKFLEIGPGTGRSTRFIKMAFPKAKIVGIDLSEPYLKKARRELKSFHGIDLVQGDGAHLPFKDQEFDAVYSVFLYHELPLEVRKEVIQESLRVLKPGGGLGYIDSIQLGDCPPYDFFLKEFPKNFHEPFYRNYISHPMKELLASESLQTLDQGLGLLSKFQLVQKR